MRKNLVTLFLTTCLFIGTAGCTITTTGEASWEIYGGIRTRQHSEQPAKVKIQSDIVDSLIDGEVSETE